MNWSLNELETETKKAIRGAGLSWGLSEEGAKAVRWFAAHGADALPAVQDILERHDRKALAPTFEMDATGRWQASQPICPIVLGSAICDFSNDLRSRPIVAGPVAQPALLIAFVARAARLLKRALRLELGDHAVFLSASGDPVAGLPAIAGADRAEIRCEVTNSKLAQVRPASANGVSLEPASMAHLATYGHRTYVPASERSRREGAGAGLLDND